MMKALFVLEGSLGGDILRILMRMMNVLMILFLPNAHAMRASRITDHHYANSAPPIRIVRISGCARLLAA
jgi:hypothetical protein